MPESTSFRSRALMSYVAVTLPLVAIVAVMIGRLQSVAAEQVERLVAEENEITMAHHLRWNAELLVSAGRGYLISGAPALLAKVGDREAQFDAAVRALENEELAPQAVSLVGEVERAARLFRDAQRALLVVRHEPEANEGLVESFEEELMPLRANLSELLARLIAYKEAALDRVYVQARRDRARLAAWTYGLLSAVTLLGLGLAWRFASLLAQSYGKERQALDAARRALSSRDDLMGILAHDLRNPLNAIALKAATLRLRSESESTRQDAESIEHTTKTMAELINTMLDVTTLEAGCFSIKPSVCEAEALLDDAVEMFANAATSNGIRLEQRRADSKITLWADRERVLQVLSNILGNALKVTPRGGTISIGVTRHRDMVRFDVSDTGPGIDDQHLPYLFNRLWKHETDPSRQGTGLGLFIAKGIVDAHGGKIWVDSEPARGAIFHFTLPVSSSVGRPPNQRAA